MSIGRTPPEPEPALADLSARIHAEHEACVGALAGAIDHAIQAGKLLIDAKGRVQHGRWAEWVSRNCRFSPRMAQNYMRLTENAARFAFADNPPRSIRQALAMLEAPAEEEAEAPAGARGPTPLHTMPEEQRHRLCAQYWDQFAGAILLHDLAGWPPDRIATFVGTTEDRVRAVLRPGPPRRFNSADNGLALLADPGSDSSSLRQAYDDAVSSLIHRWLGDGWSIARWRAESEGFPELVDAVRAEEKLCRRRCESSRDRIGYIPRLFGDAALDVALWQCAWGDAEQALLFRPPSPEWHPLRFNRWFASNLLIAREAITEAAAHEAGGGAP